MKIKVIDNFLSFADEQSEVKFVLYWLKQPFSYDEYGGSTEMFLSDVNEYTKNHLQKHRTESTLSWDISFEDPNFGSFGDDVRKHVFFSLAKQIEDFSKKPFSDFDVHRFHTNVLFPCVGGKKYHTDDTQVTAILCLSDTDGYFEYVDVSGDVQKIEDKFNRLVIFSAPNMKHKGVPPTTNSAGPRLNIALKVVLNK
jgi:hypothetical protein